MGNYNETISLTLPISLADIASKVGRALDPDVGGADSFSQVTIGYDGNTPVLGDKLKCTTPCTSDFKQQALGIFSDKTAKTLFAVTSADYEARWSTLVPPTLEECKSFLDNLVIEEKKPLAIQESM